MVRNSKVYFYERRKSTMAKIISLDECDAMERCEECPYPKCPDDEDCTKCLTRCPCCSGSEDGFCNQCPEEDCDNRNEPYDPNAISKEE